MRASRFFCSLLASRRRQHGTQPAASQLSEHQREVLKLKEEIEHSVQQQVLALRRVVADVDSCASQAVVSTVKLHNKQRYQPVPIANCNPAS